MSARGNGAARRNAGAMTGERFGRLLVIGAAPTRGRRCYVVCRCDCGASVEAQARHVRSGATLSCGCLQRDRSRESKTTHGLAVHGREHPLYGTWMGMMGRCTLPAHSAYRYYGGRGITVCERWRDASVFLADIERLIGARPDGMTLDRIDNEGHYEPGNVRWATAKQQAANKRPSSGQ